MERHVLRRLPLPPNGALVYLVRVLLPLVNHFSATASVRLHPRVPFGCAAALLEPGCCGVPHTPPISHVGVCFVSTRYDPEFDSEFGQSFAGLAWPRAAVAGGSLWNYEPTLDPTSTQFAALVTNHNNRLATRVGANVTCPNGCTCDWNSRCVCGDALSVASVRIIMFFLVRRVHSISTGYP